MAENEKNARKLRIKWDRLITVLTVSQIHIKLILAMPELLYNWYNGHKNLNI